MEKNHHDSIKCDIIQKKKLHLVDFHFHIMIKDGITCASRKNLIRMSSKAY